MKRLLLAANGGNFMRVWLSTPLVEMMPESGGSGRQVSHPGLQAFLRHSLRKRRHHGRLN